jgi:hypothetical protein
MLGILKKTTLDEAVWDLRFSRGVGGGGWSGGFIYLWPIQRCHQLLRLHSVERHVVSVQWIGKDVKGSGSGIFWRTISTLAKEYEKTTTNVSHNSRSVGFNTGLERLLSFAMWHRAGWSVLTNDSGKPTACTWYIHVESNWGLLWHWRKACPIRWQISGWICDVTFQTSRICTALLTKYLQFV